VTVVHIVIDSRLHRRDRHRVSVDSKRDHYCRVRDRHHQNRVEPMTDYPMNRMDRLDPPIFATHDPVVRHPHSDQPRHDLHEPDRDRDPHHSPRRISSDTVSIPESHYSYTTTKRRRKKKDQIGMRVNMSQVLSKCACHTRHIVPHNRRAYYPVEFGHVWMTQMPTILFLCT
jgi:hypothetical protein